MTTESEDDSLSAGNTSEDGWGSDHNEDEPTQPPTKKQRGGGHSVEDGEEQRRQQRDYEIAAQLHEGSDERPRRGVSASGHGAGFYTEPKIAGSFAKSQSRVQVSMSTRLEESASEDEGDSVHRKDVLVRPPAKKHRGKEVHFSELDEDPWSQRDFRDAARRQGGFSRPRRQVSRTHGKGFYTEHSLNGPIPSKCINTFFEDDKEAASSSASSSAASATAPTSVNGVKKDLKHRKLMNEYGMIELHVAVDPNTPLEGRLPLLDPYRPRPQHKASEDPIEIGYDKGAPPVPAHITDIKRRDYAPLSMTTREVKRLYDKRVLRDTEHDVLEFELYNPETDEVKHDQCIVARIVKPNSGFREEVCNALRGNCHQAVEIKQIRDPNDVVFKHQHSEGGGVYGVYARENIKAGTVLGQYTGLIKLDRLSEVEEEDDASPPEDYNGRKVASSPAKHGCVGGSVGRKGEQGGLSKGADESFCHPVCSQEESEGTNDESQYAITLPKNVRADDLKLYTDSKYRANEMSYINDSRNSGFRVNSEYVGGLCNEWPFIVVVTTEDIKAGKQIFVDYGEDSYWKEHEVATRERMEANIERIKEARKKEVEIKKEKERRERDGKGKEDVILYSGPVDNTPWSPSKALTQPGRRSAEGTPSHGKDGEVEYEEMSEKELEEHRSFVETSASLASECGHTMPPEFEDHLRRASEGCAALSERVNYLKRASKHLCDVLEAWSEAAKKDWDDISKEKSAVTRHCIEIGVEGSEVISSGFREVIELMKRAESRLLKLFERGERDAKAEADEVKDNRRMLEFMNPDDADNVRTFVETAKEHELKLIVLVGKANDEKERVSKEVEQVRKVHRACCAASRFANSDAVSGPGRGKSKKRAAT